MTKPAHTPGPLRLENGKNDKGFVKCYLVTDSGEAVANVTAEWQHLIAAAPEMYEALEAMFDARHADGAEWTDACLMADRALRKARGEE